MTIEITTPEQLSALCGKIEKNGGKLPVQTAMEKMEAAFDAQRQAWYGENWRKVGWYGNDNGAA